MVRYLTFTELMEQTFFAEQIECHEQIWKEGVRWRRYLKYPRFSSGLALICSEVEAVYTLPDGQVLTASQSDVVLMPRESHYSVSFFKGGRDVDIYTLNFTLKDRDGNELRLARGVEIHPGAASQLCISVAQELAEACLFSGSKLKKQALLLRLLELLAAHFEKNAEDFYPIRHGVTLLMKEWDKNEKISRYAGECGISERNFYSAFKKWSGKTPVDYRNEIRTTAAESLLVSTNFSVSEIAFKTGFEDPYYFSRVFKKQYGVSPLTYRKNGSRKGK